MAKETYYSRVYTDRPAYADFEAPAKFEAIKSIIARRLVEHPNATCSYSGGSDSDILIHMIETVRSMFQLPPVSYHFFNTGLEMEATKRHVRETAEKYGVTIEELRPKKNIVLATRDYGVPFVSKIVSAGLENVQRKNIPLSIAAEYAEAEDKPAKYAELCERYPKSKAAITFLVGCNSAGEPRPEIQLAIGSNKYLLDFIIENPIPFRVSNKCCTYCKKIWRTRCKKTLTWSSPGSVEMKVVCALSPARTTRPCVLLRREMASSACAHCFTSRTRTSNGTRTTTVSDTPTPTRCTASSGRAAADARFRRAR